MTPFFVTGGTMKPDAASYVPREADEQLYNAVLAGEYCNVLTTRQMGKSSLMARTAARLRLQGVACATVDLQGKGDEIPAPEQWYYGVTKQICTGLDLSFDLSDWWRGQSLLLPAQRMTDFFADVVLKQIAGPVVVFIDEVDWMIRLKFSDEFFAAVRSCFNRRATEPAFNRLTFVLLGSAAPAQLIRDATRTPFNVGRGIELTDFTPKEAETLAGALGGDGEAILSRILYWTDGHPYLTQMLCAKVVESKRNGQQPEERVDAVVQDNLLATSARQEENNLKFVADRLTQGTRDLRGVLRVYRDVLRGKAVKDVPASAIHTSLRLSGAVKPDAERQLRIRNLVYRRVFDEGWVREKMPLNLIAVAGATAAMLAIGGFVGWYLLLYPRPYVGQLEAASKDVPYDAYAALQKPFLRARADDLFAQFWERRGDRDAAILVRARAADQGDERKRLASLIGADYPSLVGTMRHDDEVHAVQFCPNGETVLTVSGDNTARLFEAASGREISRIVLPDISSPGPLIHSATFSHDCKLVATRSIGHGARLFDAATGRKISHFAEQDDVWAVALSADGRLVATASFGKTVRVFVAATGREVSHVSYQDHVYAVALSPDGKLLATSSFDKPVHVLEAATGREVYRLNRQGGVFALAFSPDGKLLATGSNYFVPVFEAATGREVYRLNSVSAVFVLAFSPDGKLLATGSLDNTARVFETATGREISRVAQQGVVSAISFNPKGRLVAIGSDDKTARVFEAATGRGAPRLTQQGVVGGMAFSPNGKLVATGSDDQTVRVFEAATGREVSRLAHSVVVTGVRFSPDDKLVATAYEDKTAWVFEAATGRVVSRLAQQGAVTRLAFSPDSKLVATGSEDETMHVFEAATGREVFRLARQGTNIIFAFSPDGHLIATGSWDKTGQVFEAATGREVSRLGHTVWVVAFSPDGKLVATGSDDKTARVFEAATGREVSRLAEEGRVTAVAFSPDGKLIATGSVSEDKTVRVFEAATGREVSRLAQQSGVNVVAFSPDGTLLVTQAGNWLNLYRRENDRWRPVGGRHLPVIWRQTVRFLPKGDRCRHCIEVVRDTPENMFKLERINFDEYPDAPIQGDAAHLLAEWSAKLGLTFDARGRIVPLQH